MKREIVLDTETTGLSAENGDKIVAVGAVELIDGKQTGKTFYEEINPLRSVPPEISDIHGLTDERLKDKPTFPQIAPSFLDFIGDSPLIIHNASFDTAFLNAELTAADFLPIVEDRIVDTLPIAKRLFPEKRVNLAALCKRFDISLEKRTLHGALLDAQLLAEVYVCLREKEFENCLETGNINDIKKRYENEAHIYTHLITLLTRAAWFGRSDICQWLVDEKAADVNAKSCYDRTPLIYAAGNGHLDVCKWLVREKKAKVEATDNEGRSALMRAALCGHLDVCKWLADEAGADVNAVDMLERTVLLHAVKGGHLDVCKWLINEKDAEAGGKNILIEAAAAAGFGHAHADLCRWLVEKKGADVNATDEDGETALIYAALKGNSDIVTFLVGAGANVNQRTKDGYTVLMAAAMSGNIDMVRFLTEHGADVNAEDAYDETTATKPLTFFEMTKTLLRMKNGRLSRYEIRKKS